MIACFISGRFKNCVKLIFNIFLIFTHESLHMNHRVAHQRTGQSSHSVKVKVYRPHNYILWYFIINVKGHTANSCSTKWYELDWNRGIYVWKRENRDIHQRQNDLNWNWSMACSTDTNTNDSPEALEDHDQPRRTLPDSGPQQLSARKRALEAVACFRSPSVWEQRKAQRWTHQSNPIGSGYQNL